MAHEPHPDLRAVVLTMGRASAYGGSVWARLVGLGIVPVGLLVEEPASRVRPRDVLVRIRREGFGSIVGAVLRRVGLGRGASSAPPSARPDSNPPTVPDVVAAAESAGVPHRIVTNLNGDDAIAFLRTVRTDLLVLAGSRILKRPILEVPRIGTINAHMAPLPGRRGMNVAEWGLWEGGETGVTVHFVDPGVDTGPILVARPRPREKGESLATFRRALFDLQVELLGEAAAAVRDGTADPRPQPRETTRQYFSMHARLRAVLETRLAAADSPGPWRSRVD